MMIDVYQPIVKNKNAKQQDNPAEGFVADYVRGELEKGGAKDAARLYESRVRGRTLMLANPAKESRVRKERREARERRRAERERAAAAGTMMSRREAKERGVWRVGRSSKLRYEMFVGLHEIWEAYMDELLGSDATRGGESMLAKAAKADMHGALIRVVSSRNVSVVGIEGIVVRDLSGVYQVVTRDDRVLTIPKANTLISTKYVTIQT